MSIPECIESQKGKKGINYGQTPASLLPLQLESLKLGSEQLTPNKTAQLSRFTIKDWIDTALNTAIKLFNQSISHEKSDDPTGLGSMQNTPQVKQLPRKISRAGGSVHGGDRFTSTVLNQSKSARANQSVFTCNQSPIKKSIIITAGDESIVIDVEKNGQTDPKVSLKIDHSLLVIKDLFTST